MPEVANLDNPFHDESDEHEMLPRVPMVATGDDGEPAQGYRLVEGLLRVLVLQQDALHHPSPSPTPEGMPKG